MKSFDSSVFPSLTTRFFCLGEENKFRFQTRTRHQSDSLFDFLPPLGQAGFVVAKQPHLQVSQLAEVDLEYWTKTRECPQKENSN